MTRPEPPHCVRPGCTRETVYVFEADAYGRLGGQDWKPGDRLHCCRDHGADIYRTVGQTDPAKVADWLRPESDDPPNTWHTPRYWYGRWLL